MPWGISESGYNMTDAQLNYQYRAFGVPGLGFKRGLADDLVIAPYATAMALMVDPEAACANLRRLAARRAPGGVRLLRGDRLHAAAPAARAGAASIVRSFMAHHQGMSFLSLAYLLLDRPMQRRFAADPAVPGHRAAAPGARAQDAARSTRTRPRCRRARSGRRRRRRPTAASSPTPDTPAPEVHLLSNGRYHVMVTAAGGGYSRWSDLAVTRWREDATRDCWGTFCYLRDVDERRVLVGGAPADAQDGGELRGDLLAGPRRVPPPRRRHRDAHRDQRLARGRHRAAPHQRHQPRRGRRARSSSPATPRWCSPPPAADAAHPAFSNLFVQTRARPRTARRSSAPAGPAPAASSRRGCST